MPQILELERFDEHLYCSQTGHSEGNSTDGIEVKNEEFLVPLVPFLRVCVRIYKPSFTLESAVLASIGKAQFESTEFMVCFETAALREIVVCEASSSVVSKAQLRQSLSDTCIMRKRSARDVLFQQLWYHCLMSTYLA